jgi:hypothetical protein
MRTRRGLRQVTTPAHVYPGGIVAVAGYSVMRRCGASAIHLRSIDEQAGRRIRWVCSRVAPSRRLLDECCSADALFLSARVAGMSDQALRDAIKRFSAVASSPCEQPDFRAHRPSPLGERHHLILKLPGLFLVFQRLDGGCSRTRTYGPLIRRRLPFGILRSPASSPDSVD